MSGKGNEGPGACRVLLPRQVKGSEVAVCGEGNDWILIFRGRQLEAVVSDQSIITTTIGTSLA